MNSQADIIKKRLNLAIQDLDRIKDQFVRSPGKDFTRKRRLDFASVVSILISMGGGSTFNCLTDYFPSRSDVATTAAFVQQRAKLKPEALEYLFHRFSQGLPSMNTFCGFRLLAVDGSSLQIFPNANDRATYYPGANGQHPYSLLHLNALYDLENRIYLDALVQKSRERNENIAFTDMIDRSPIKHALLFADRGYESYNNLAHLQEKGWYYIIRVKDNTQSILGGLMLRTSDEFDLAVERFLTRKPLNEINAVGSADPALFKRLAHNIVFDYLPTNICEHDPPAFYKISFRIVRFHLSEDSFETVITNLPSDRYTPSDLKQLYARRWGIETSFRHLKYTIGIAHFHAKKVEHIYQEIFAKLTMYNFCELITSSVVIQKRSTKYAYSVNFANAVHVCRKYFLLNGSPPNVEALLSKLLVPIRPGRSNTRKLRPKPSFSFIYRVA